MSSARDNVARRRRLLTLVAAALLALHVAGAFFAGLVGSELRLVATLSALAGFLAVPLASWVVSRLLDRAVDRIVPWALLQVGARFLIGVVLIGAVPYTFAALRDLPLPLIGRALELLTAVLSIGVMSGLVLLGIAMADLIYHFTSGVRRIGTRMMILLLVASLWIFLWMSLFGLQGQAIIEWAIAQGHLEGYVADASIWRQIGGAYVGAIAGVLSLQLPFIMILAWRFGRNTTRDLGELRRAFERVSHGALEPIEIHGRDEIAEMQRGFNEMLDAVKEQRFLETAFGRYVSPHVLDKLREAPEGHDFPGERVEATVLFSDIRGFTALSAEMEPEEVIELLNTYVACMIDVIEAHDGYINKFVGDAIMVVWNTPVVDPDHALRACACAATMQLALHQANENGAFGDAQLEMGIGINTGPLVAGNLGDERQAEFTVLGDTVNVASRACSAAEGGRVALSESCVEVAREQAGSRPGGFELEVEDLGEVELKGKGPTPLYLLRSGVGALARVLGTQDAE